MKTVEGRTGTGLMAEVARLAINDAGLTKKDIDGILAEPPFGEPEVGYPSVIGEYLQIYPHYASTVGLQGASAAGMIWRAAAAIDAGLCNNVLCVTGIATRPGNIAEQRARRPLQRARAEFENPYGPKGSQTP